MGKYKYVIFNEINRYKVPERKLFYKYTTNDSINVIINSCIVSPIAWSWFAKPIANKLGIDYKNKYKL